MARDFGIGFRDDHDDHISRDRWHVLWKRWTVSRGVGQPVLSGGHPSRQRRAMLDMLCQFCFLPAEDTILGTLFLLGDTTRSGLRGPVRDGEITSTPPVHLACALSAVELSPDRLKGLTAARVKAALPWGVIGTRYKIARPFPVAEPDLTSMSYDNDNIRFMLAQQALVELHGCEPVDLVEEARNACP
ncbi:hypothetical protein [Streptomyces sp. NPDC004435]|uniref:hypothetical protein n=1 Tax=Streptomyces sp. NPDC004435 TaxID=3364701 RepID=UPI0036A45B24